MTIHPTLSLRVLGLVSAGRGGQQVSLGPRLQRACLAVLMCHANRPVSRDALVEALWDGRAPHTGPKNVQKYIHGLRRALGAPERISHDSSGYTLHAGADELDLLQFRELAEAGRRARVHGADAAAASLWDQALGLWGGRPSEASALGSGLEREFERLDSEYLAVFEDWAEAQLDAGGPGIVAERAGVLVVVYPLRERLRVAQIRALYACGRQREALGAYDELRQHLARELGLEPSPALAELYHSLLERPEGMPGRQTTGRRRPIQPLPRDLPDFTGRGTLLAELHSVTEPGALAVAWGLAGAGKTSAVVRVAHQAARRFPGGCVYVRMDDAGGASGVLRRLYRAAGIGDDMPPGEDEAAEVWRAWLSHRHMLVVLDGAVAESEVRALLPPAGPAAVLVAARTRLAGLQHARWVGVGGLEVDDAVELLGRIAGAERVWAERAAAGRIARLVGCSALGVRAAGMRLAAQPNLLLEVFADRLEPAHLRLERLRSGDLSLREAMYAAAAELPDKLGAALEILAREAPDGFSVSDAARALDCDLAAAAARLEELADVAVLENDDTGEVLAHVQLFRVPLLLRLALREDASS